MKIIICLEDNNGIAFNKRRLSSDSVLCEKICEMIKGSRLCLNSYSAKLFEQICDNQFVDENFADKADAGDYCFFEKPNVCDYASDAEEIVVFRWNRRYPSDARFPERYLLTRKLVATEDFSGKSHDKITMEVYR